VGEKIRGWLKKTGGPTERQIREREPSSGMSGEIDAGERVGGECHRRGGVCGGPARGKMSFSIMRGGSRSNKRQKGGRTEV